jgi:isopenicillin N synthase-like dioxygenase
MTAAASFPVFDLSRFEKAGLRERRRLGQEVDGIYRATGFLAISGHSCRKATIDAI